MYVLNSMGTANVTSFALDGSGKLRPRNTAALTAGATGAAQVSVSPDGRSLVVSVRQSNRIETFPLRFGRIGAPVVTASAGAVPFGFAFSERGDLVVSEAGASTVSSYRRTAAAPRPNDLAVVGRYLYAVNPAAGEVTAIASPTTAGSPRCPASPTSATSPGSPPASQLTPGRPDQGRPRGCHRNASSPWKARTL